MASYDMEMLAAARLLGKREAGQRGRLSSARVRRSISTTYYALFHFIVDEVGRLLIGTTNDTRTRRRILARTITHSGITTALDKIRGQNADLSIEDFVRMGNGIGNVQPPEFAKEFARVFSDAKSKRHDADYNLNENLGEKDAQLLHNRAKRVIKDWRSATAKSDRDFKKALCLLILLKGKLRSDAA